MLTRSKTGLDRQAILAQAQSLLNKANFTREDSSRAENLLRLADSLDPQIDTALRHARLAQHAKAMNVRSEYTPIDPDYESAFHAFLRDGWEVLTPEQRALASGSDSAGGFTCPQEIVDVFQNALKLYDGIFDAARIVETSHGNIFNWPMGDDTATAATIVAENAISILTPDPPFVNLQFGKVPMWRSGHIRASMELGQDSHYDLGAVLAEIAAARMARGIGAQMVTNLIAQATSGATSAGASAVTPDDLLSLMASVDPLYGQRGSFLMNFATLTSVLKVKASTGGNYMLDVELDAAGRPTLFGRTVYLCPSMAAISTGNKCVAFGAMDMFLRRHVAGSLAFKVYVERYAELAQTAYEAFWRCDSALVKPTTAPIPIRYLTQA